MIVGQTPPGWAFGGGAARQISRRRRAVTSGESEESRHYHKFGRNCWLSYSQGHDAASLSPELQISLKLVTTENEHYANRHTALMRRIVLPEAPWPDVYCFR